MRSKSKYIIAQSIILTLMMLFLFRLVQAAPIRSSEPKELNTVIKALRLPVDDRIKKIDSQGQRGLDGLVTIAFDKKQPLENRWRAVTAMGRLYSRVARMHLEKALKSEEWFMRNSAAITLKYSERSWGIHWARILMHDQALVVRTAAVQALQEMKATEAKDLLWEKLNSTENFKSGQSLWIRKHIAQTLLTMNAKGDEGQFVKMLDDKDRAVRGVAISALKNITSKNYDTPEQWSAWWSQQNNSSIVR